MSFDRPENLHDTFAASLARRDVPGALDLYEPGAVSATPDGTEVRGHEALRAMLTELTDLGNAMVGSQRSTVVVGDLALTSTRWSAEIPTDAGTATRHGTTAEVSRRQPDGTWRVVIDSPFFAQDR